MIRTGLNLLEGKAHMTRLLLYLFGLGCDHFIQSAAAALFCAIIFFLSFAAAMNVAGECA